jgi:hypothetical protein
MLQNRRGELLDVVGQGMIAALERGERFRGPEQQQRRAGACAEVDARVAPGGLAEGDDVAPERLRAVDGGRGSLHRQHRAGVGHRLEIEDEVVAGVGGEHLGFLVGVRVAEGELDHEPVELGLGERIRPLVLDRVLRRDHDEGARELVRLIVDRHVPLLHALEQARLGLRGCAVDLVHEDDVREHRTRVELEARLSLVEDVRADDVGGQQVDRALNARVFRGQRSSQRACEGRLADSRIVLDQDVSLRQEGDQDVSNDLVAHLHRSLDIGSQLRAALRYRLEIDFRQRRHSLMVRAESVRGSCPESGLRRAPRVAGGAQGRTYDATRMYDLEIGVACACLASILFALGVTLQALEARDVSHRHALRPSLFRRLVARPRWVFATVLVAAGWPLHVVALLLAPLTVVQPALASGLLLLLVLGDRMLGERVGAIEVGAVVAIVAGVAGMAWAAPGHTTDHAGALRLATALGILGLFAVAPYASRREAAAASALLPVSAGCAYAWTGTASKLIADDLSTSAWLAACCWALAIGAVAAFGLLSEMSALQRRPATRVVPVVFVVQITIPVVLAPVIAGESWASTPLGGAALVGFCAMVAAGAAALGRSAAVSGLVGAGTDPLAEAYPTEPAGDGPAI